MSGVWVWRPGGNRNHIWWYGKGYFAKEALHENEYGPWDDVEDSKDELEVIYLGTVKIIEQCNAALEQYNKNNPNEKA